MIDRHLHRRVLPLRTGSPKSGLGVKRELRKDRPRPVVLAGLTLEDFLALWQVFADDFDNPNIYRSKEEINIWEGYRSCSGGLRKLISTGAPPDPRTKEAASCTPASGVVTARTGTGRARTAADY